jgi:hypothetical protein
VRTVSELVTFMFVPTPDPVGAEKFWPNRSNVIVFDVVALFVSVTVLNLTCAC